MIISEIYTEGAVQIFGRSKGKVVRKYRCTSGQKKPTKRKTAKRKRMK